MAYLVWMFAVGYVLDWYQNTPKEGFGEKHFFPFFWYVILCHYAMDSLVWRRPSKPAAPRRAIA